MTYVKSTMTKSDDMDYQKKNNFPLFYTVPRHTNITTKFQTTVVTGDNCADV